MTQYKYIGGKFKSYQGIPELPEWPEGTDLEEWTSAFCGGEIRTISPAFGFSVTFFDIRHDTDATLARGVLAWVEPVRDCGFLVHIPYRLDLLRFMAELEPMLRVARMVAEIENEKGR